MRHHHRHNRDFHAGMPEDCCGEDDFRSDMPRVMRKMMTRGMPGMGGHSPFMGRGRSHGPGMRRHFISKTEKIEHLEKYKDQLQKELAGLEEYIAEMKQTKNE